MSIGEVGFVCTDEQGKKLAEFLTVLRDNKDVDGDIRVVGPFEGGGHAGEVESPK